MSHTKNESWDGLQPLSIVMINRVGTFFAVLGVGLIGLFLLSDITDAPTCSYLLIGAVFLVLGIILWLRDPAPPPQETGGSASCGNLKKQDKNNRQYVQKSILQP